MHRFPPRYYLFLVVIGLLAIGLWFSPPSRLANAEQSAQPVKDTAPEADTDLVIDNIEVTQVVQDMNNGVPLVAGKRTYVRVYAHSTSGTWPTTATLRLQYSSNVITLLPIPPGGHLINVRTAYNRLLPGHAFLFELPLSYTYSSSLTLTAEINPNLRWHPRNPQESDYSNNSMTKMVSFTSVPPLTLVIASQPYKFNNITYTPRAIDRYRLLSWVNRAYPVSQVKVYFRTLPTVNATRTLNKFGGYDLTYPNCGQLNSYLAYNRYSIAGNPFIVTPGTAFYAMVADDVGFMRGCSPIGGQVVNTSYINWSFVHVGSGPSGDSDWGWDYDGSYADWYGGHEIGHAFGQSHVTGGPGVVKDGCGGEAGAGANYPNGRISPTTDIFSPSAVFGFDSLKLFTGTNPILSPLWHDVMTYCDYQWISKATYTELRNAFSAVLPRPSTSPAGTLVAQDVWVVVGTLNPQSGAVSLQPLSVLHDQPDITLPEPGPYAIVLYGSGGDELARYPFTPHDMEMGPAPDETEEAQVAYIAETIPYQEGISLLTIEGPGGILYEVGAGLNLPYVQVIWPNGGEWLADGDVTVSWWATDDDGDPLTFNVEYSPDYGVSWEPVALFLTGTEVTIDQFNLPASEVGLFRVTASDGIHSASDASDDVFGIPNHVPSGEINTTILETTVALNQTVTFEAQVYDIDLGLLDGDSLQWFSDRDGLLGSGATLSTASLSEGLHEITLFAYDGWSETFIDQVVVIVVATPNDLPPQPDALLVGPDPVFIIPSSGVTVATIYLDSLNLGNILEWEVTSDVAWMQLDTTFGITPQDVTVTTSLTPLDFGTHKATLTFSSPEMLFDPVSIEVNVVMPRYISYLPVVTR
jgi:hypothetical protein